MQFSEELDLSRGKVELPLFLPVATRGFVKAVPMQKVNQMNIKALISNSVHLTISPGLETLERTKGINGYTGFNGSYFTDSGGFQILREELVKIEKDGILFRDRKSGKSVKVTPEISSEIQRKIGSDVAMMLDDCPPYGADEKRYSQSVMRTFEWGRVFSTLKAPGQKRFGIIQGGFDADLRKESATLMTSLEFDGFAIGGLKIGEPKELTDLVLNKTLPLVPNEFPIYLMGVGDPISIVEYSEAGIGVFDSTYPTRNARHGFALTNNGPVNLKNAKHFYDFGPIENGCSCETCTFYNRSKLRELYKNEDPSFQYLVTVHNLDFMQRFMDSVRNERENARTIAKRFSKINYSETNGDKIG
ncbi:MAG: tRNA guanosine(34) transglycosylase Tgt [Thermoplasmatales archaeon]|nr:tRNA guanosine(34) transglycosylase Tgt [Candidatus Thermoplasmatota archaeon]MCL6002886.1 tRNA guanosine(34) transglycosylase Tgt [Candidatus Thermoplasmatota archaeon]MDA8056274.1 tRNA guanosine(34) transglycosylase Tgt [Thermoplasmatales archaeon]